MMLFATAYSYTRRLIHSDRCQPIAHVGSSYGLVLKDGVLLFRKDSSHLIIRTKPLNRSSFSFVNITLKSCPLYTHELSNVTRGLHSMILSTASHISCSGVVPIFRFLDL